jgi:hypothetical protein
VTIYDDAARFRLEARALNQGAASQLLESYARVWARTSKVTIYRWSTKPGSTD